MTALPKSITGTLNRRLNLSVPRVTRTEPTCWDSRTRTMLGNAWIYADDDQTVEVSATVDDRYVRTAGALPGEEIPEVTIHGAVIGKLAVDARAIELAYGDLTEEFIKAWREDQL